MKSSKAQVAILDLVLAFVAAFALVSLLLAFIDQPTDLINDRFRVEDKLIKGIEATDILLNSYGIPINWNPQNVILPSIVSSQNVLNIKKIEMFKNLDYETKKAMLNINEFNYTLIIKTKSTQIIDGILNQDEETVTINRIALLGNENAYIQFKVW